MKRPPGLWLLLTIVALWLKVQDVYSVKATALIFGKTTTTTTLAPPSESSSGSSDAGSIEASSVETETQNSTKPQLTGIPQIDYIYDPNLPRELNGYNLSEYPFYDRVPEDINFKCDGLHDGFYASVPHKCQVYHHCLFGIRYDFLCANYTAFDQKTFICHFVSEVDCLNSKKFWHRNDALYKAATTTTVKPPPVYTLPPAPATPVPIVPILQRRPERPRRPLARRRPYEYYDEEYDDEYYEKPVRRQRPRYRPRVYDDEYDYEEEDYVRRPNGRRNENRKPYKSRNSNRRRPYDDEEYDDEETDDARRPDGGRRNSDDSRRPLKRRPSEDDEYDRRPYDRPRKKGYRRPIDEEYEDDPPPRRASDRRKNKNRDERDGDDEEERPRSKSSRDDRPRQNNDRNRNNDSVNDDSPRNRNDRNRTKNEESSGDDRTSRNNDKIKPDEYDDKPLQKPPSSIYDRQRPALKIRPPVPAHEQSKYSPKVPKTTTPEPLEEEYYDDLQEDIKRQEEPRRATAKENNRKFSTTTQSSSKRGYGNVKRPADYEDDLESVTRRSNKRPKYGDDNFGNKERRAFSNSRRRPVIEEYDDYEEKSQNSPEKSTSTTTTTTTSTTTKEPPREPVVKVVKRPFLLPSRGGSPYPRGLLPVGAKASETSSNDQLQDTKFRDETAEVNTDNKLVKVIKIPVIRNNKNNYDEEFTPISNRPITRIVKIPNTTTTEKPKVFEKNPLDLDENEYDVTLNDALNPTLPNLPIRNFPTGFSAQNDYTYNTVQRPRYVVDPIINQASSDYVYRIEQPEANNIRYKAVPVFQSFRQSPRVTQAIYSPY